MFALRFEATWLRIAFASLCALGVFVAWFLLRRNRSDLPPNRAIRIVGDGGAEVSGYLAAYLLPFLTLAAPPLLDGLAYLIFFVVAGVVYVRSGLMQVNPTIYLLGWRVARGAIDIDGRRERDPFTKEVFVITRRERRVGEAVRGERFSDRVYVDHSDNQSKGGGNGS